MEPTNMTDATNDDLALYSKTIINKVWKKGFPIYGYNSQTWRYDIMGKPINYREYNNRNSRYGWVIDVIDANRTKDRFAIDNLQPACVESVEAIATQRVNADKAVS